MSNIADYEVFYVTQTEHAVAIRQDDDHHIVWLPKSQIDFDDSQTYKRHQVIRIGVPDWLAEKHDLV